MTEYERYRQIAIDNGISGETYRQRIKYYNYTFAQAATRPLGKRRNKKGRDIAIYRGDELILWGSPQEVAEKLGKKVETVKFICYPAYKNRYESLDGIMYGIFIEND